MKYASLCNTDKEYLDNSAAYHVAVLRAAHTIEDKFLQYVVVCKLRWMLRQSTCGQSWYSVLEGSIASKDLPKLKGQLETITLETFTKHKKAWITVERCDLYVEKAFREIGGDFTMWYVMKTA